MEAGGVGLFKSIDNTQLIDLAKRQKRWKPQNSPQLERIWNARYSVTKRNSGLLLHFFTFVSSRRQFTRNHLESAWPGLLALDEIV